MVTGARGGKVGVGVGVGIGGRVKGDPKQRTAAASVARCLVAGSLGILAQRYYQRHPNQSGKIKELRRGLAGTRYPE